MKTWWRKNKKSDKEIRCEEFESTFGFPVGKINENRYKKEALLKLGLLAKNAHKEAQTYSPNPTNYVFKAYYDLAFANYQSAFASLEHFDPQLAAAMPHWTELPEFTNEWIAGGHLQEEATSADAPARPRLVLLTRRAG